MDDEVEYQELLKAEANEKRDTQLVMKCIIIILLLLAAAIVLTGCDSHFPYIYEPDYTHFKKGGIYEYLA